MAGSQISTSVTIIDSLSGFMALSLTEYNTSAAASIAAGSKVEIAGAFFTFAGDEAIEVSTWTSIVTGNTAYITLTASGTAGSQIVVAAYTATAPTWRDDLQGWYASAASNVRVIGSVYKAEATSYTPKILIKPIEGDYKPHGKQIFISSGTFIVPPNVNYVYLTGCAAGGNGGNCQVGATASGGGGGGGETVYNKKVSVTPNSIIPVIIGSVGSNTIFGTISFNYGVNGSAASGGIFGGGGAGGALVNGTVAGGSGGAGSLTVGIAGNKNGFADPGLGGGSASYGGGGGGASLGNFAYYYLNTSGGNGTGVTATAGGAGGDFGGGGGGGGGGSTTGGNGGVGGYGCGGGGGGGITGTGGAGGPAILIVEW